jgi:site-specific recombinase XerD
VGIDKRVTTHIGRHTFATTIALENGVGIESVSKMLGHSKISQTQRYAKVTSLKIERETRGLFEKLKF